MEETRNSKQYGTIVFLVLLYLIIHVLTINSCERFIGVKPSYHPVPLMEEYPKNL